jgi:hypothetical protein
MANACLDVHDATERVIVLTAVTNTTAVSIYEQKCVQHASYELNCSNYNNFNYCGLQNVELQFLIRYNKRH